MGVSRRPAKQGLLRRSSMRVVRRSSKRVPRPSWKLLGLAGVAGVAATGVVVARKRRAHVDLAPDELRDRLHERLEAAAKTSPPQPPDPANPSA